MIYAIEADGLSLVKIGRSQNPLERFASLKTASPVPLKLLCCVDWHDENENLIHRAFSGNSHNGEWFRVDYDLADFLNVMMCPNATKERKFEVAMEMLAERLKPPVDEVAPKKDVSPPGEKFDRKAYQRKYMREYMRKRRKKERGE